MGKQQQLTARNPLLPNNSQRFIAPLAKTIADIARTLHDYARRTQTSLTEFYTGLAGTVREKLWPAAHEALRKVAHAVGRLADDTYGLVLSIAETLVATLRQFEPEFAQFGQRVTALAKRLGEYGERYARWARKEATDLWQLVRDALQEVPGWEYVRERFAEVSFRGRRR